MKIYDHQNKVIFIRPLSNPEKSTVKRTEKQHLLAYDHLNANVIKMPIYFMRLVYVFGSRMF